MFKRVTLYVVTNLAVLILLSIVLNILAASGVFGPDPLTRWVPLLIFAAVWGFGGSIISLLLSKTIAKWSTGAQVIPQPRNPDEAWLFETVQRQAGAYGIGDDGKT